MSSRSAHCCCCSPTKTFNSPTRPLTQHVIRQHGFKSQDVRVHISKKKKQLSSCKKTLHDNQWRQWSWSRTCTIHGFFNRIYTIHNTTGLYYNAVSTPIYCMVSHGSQKRKNVHLCVRFLIFRISLNLLAHLLSSHSTFGKSDGSGRVFRSRRGSGRPWTPPAWCVKSFTLLPFLSFGCASGFLCCYFLACVNGHFSGVLCHSFSNWLLLFPRRWFLLDYTNCASLCEFLRTNLASRPDETVDKGIDWLCFVKREGFHWDKDMGWWKGGTRHSFQQSVQRPLFSLSFPHLAKLFPEIFQYGLHCM